MNAAVAPLWFEKTARSGARRMGGSLATIMAMVAKAWSRDLGKLASLPVEITFKGSGTPTIETVLARVAASTTFAALSTPWNTPLLLRFDKRFVVIMVEALFGSSGDEEAIEATPAPLSRIEIGVADAVGAQVAKALSEGFAETAGATFTFDGLLAKLDPGELGKPQGSVLVVSFAITALGQTVELDVLFPQAALDELGEDLTSVFDLARLAPDPLWSERLEAEVGRATVNVKALVEAVAMTVQQMAALQPGQVLPLPAGAGSKVRLACEDRDLFHCELGQSAGHYTVRISAPAPAR